MNLMMFAPLSWRGARCTSSCSSNRRVIRYLGFIFWGVFLFVFFPEVGARHSTQDHLPPRRTRTQLHPSLLNFFLLGLTSLHLCSPPTERERERERGEKSNRRGLGEALWFSLSVVAIDLKSGCMSFMLISPFDITLRVVVF